MKYKLLPCAMLELLFEAPLRVPPTGQKTLMLAPEAVLFLTAKTAPEPVVVGRIKLLFEALEVVTSVKYLMIA
jgi:hypothetical protein